MLQPPIGELGSANWDQVGDPIPKTLILCDLSDDCLSLLTTKHEGSKEDRNFSECTLLTASAVLPPFPEEFSIIEELDLSGNALDSIPDNINNLTNLRSLFLGGYPTDHPERKNKIQALPNLSSLIHLEHLSVHDTNLSILPELPMLSLRILRVDRCPLDDVCFAKGKMQLPPNLTTLHLEGCSLSGSLERPDLLPDCVKELKYLEDLQLPDGCHIGLFFGMPVNEAVSMAEKGLKR